ncbi:unnamed protein product [Prorocentrum cordatum]|uniref:Uncharacterized protein n=1 Tax=Prorocentrum cordatum TaxID=2364126 RepID=A0ABN9T889_9DINO|nr:unnamed protein product [Polarella glacialis]
MREAKLKPDVISYSQGISACGKREQWQAALLLLSDLGEAKLETNVISHSAGVSACEKGGQWQRALLLFGEIGEAKLQPNVIINLQCWDQRVRDRCAVAAGSIAAQRNEGGESGS